MSDNKTSFRIRVKQNPRAAKDFHLRETKCKAYETYISKLGVPWILRIFTIYNQQMHNVFNINCIRKLLHVCMPQCIIIWESLLMIMHWDIETCRSFPIQLSTKYSYVVYLLVIHCKYLRCLILLPQLRRTFGPKVWHNCARVDLEFQSSYAQIHMVVRSKRKFIQLDNFSCNYVIPRIV